VNTTTSISKQGHVCPWWFIRSFDNPVRLLFQKPETILKELVQSGDHCLDLGCGYGYFTIPMARLVGPTGVITAVDIQPEMLAGVRRRAEKSGLSQRINLRLSDSPGLVLEEVFDAALAFWMIHEVPDQKSMLLQIRNHLRSGGRFLLVEPKAHVNLKAFNQTVAIAEESGLTKVRDVQISFSRGVLMTNGPGLH
jgi:ubiquinone/menaquinone biosynthesis C-methylase UbiE